MHEKLALLGTAVRALIGGHMSTVFLTDYDSSSDSYWGEAHRNFAMGDKALPVVISIRGLRPYPYIQRPDYAFQFVLPGENEQPLLDIAAKNAHPLTNANPPTVSHDAPEQPSSEGFDPADTNRDGVVTKKEQKWFDREN